MTSSNGNIFRVTGHLCGEFTGPPHKGQWREALMFSLICARINSWVNNGESGDLRRHRGHYDVIVMSRTHNTVLPRGRQPYSTFPEVNWSNLQIPECTCSISHISFLNGALRDMEQVHPGICEIDLLSISLVGYWFNFMVNLTHCGIVTPYGDRDLGQICTLLFWMEHCGIWNRCIQGFVKLIYCQYCLCAIDSTLCLKHCGLVTPYGGRYLGQH